MSHDSHSALVTWTTKKGVQQARNTPGEEKIMLGVDVCPYIGDSSSSFMCMIEQTTGSKRADTFWLDVHVILYFYYLYDSVTYFLFTYSYLFIWLLYLIIFYFILLYYYIIQSV